MRSRGRYGGAYSEAGCRGNSSRRFTILPAVSLNAGDITKTLATHAAQGESIVNDGLTFAHRTGLSARRGAAASPSPSRGLDKSSQSNLLVSHHFSRPDPSQPMRAFPRPHGEQV